MSKVPPAFATLALLCALVISATADETGCRSLGDAQREITAAGGGKLRPLSQAQLYFARGAYAEYPPQSPYPPGDKGMIAMFSDGSSAVVFVDGDRSCGELGSSPFVTKIMLAIEDSI